MRQAESTDLQTRAARVKLLVLDADGVLTDGGLYHGPGEEEQGLSGPWVRFDIKDGMGLWRLQQAGCQIAIVSGRVCETLRGRAEYLGITEVHQGILDKPDKVRELVRTAGLALDEVAFMGDDVNDLDVMGIVGLPAAPADAWAPVRAAAAFVAERPGGRGAVRELCELIIEAQDGAAVG